LLRRSPGTSGRADRIGLVGANGAGKSTLLRVLTGALPAGLRPDPDRRHVKAAMLSQELREAACTPAGYWSRGGSGASGLPRRPGVSAAQFAEVFGFTGARL